MRYTQRCGLGWRDCTCAWHTLYTYIELHEGMQPNILVASKCMLNVHGQLAPLVQRWPRRQCPAHLCAQLDLRLGVHQRLCAVKQRAHSAIQMLQVIALRSPACSGAQAGGSAALYTLARAVHAPLRLTLPCTALSDGWPARCARAAPSVDGQPLPPVWQGSAADCSTPHTCPPVTLALRRQRG